MGLALSILTSRETLFHAISGAIASATSISVFYPLETIRTRKQANRAVSRTDATSQPILVGLARSLKRIYLTEGFQGLYRGYHAVVATLFLSNFVYFYAYVYLKTLFQTLHSDGAHPRNSLVDLLTAFLAGCFNVLVTTPMWVANTRLKLEGVSSEDDGGVKKEFSPSSSKPNNKKIDENSNRSLSSTSSSAFQNPSTPPKPAKYDGLLNTMVTIAKEEGPLALYSGILPSLLLVLNPTFQWTIYELLKFYCQNWTGSVELSAATYFVASAVAKFCSTTSTYPLQVVQTRMRFQQPTGSSHQSSSTTTRILKAMMLEEGGLRGLFKGFESKIVQTVLTSAFMFVVYEKTVAFLIRHWLSNGN